MAQAEICHFLAELPEGEPASHELLALGSAALHEL